MSSALYRRYIPPPHQIAPDIAVKTENITSTGKKRKRSGNNGIPPNAEADTNGDSTQPHPNGSTIHSSRLAQIRQDSGENLKQQKLEGTFGTGIGANDVELSHTVDGSGTKKTSRIESELRQRPQNIKTKSRHQQEDDNGNDKVEVPRIRAGTHRFDGEYNGQMEGTGPLAEEFGGKNGVADTKHTTIHEKFQRSQNLANGGTGNEGSEESLLDENKPTHDVELHDLVPLPQPDPVPESVVKRSFSALPPWLAEPIKVSGKESRLLEELDITPKVLTALQNKSYRTTFAVQSAVLPLLLPGAEQHIGDVCISAATGSGKTLAYTLPIMESLRTRTVIRLRALIVVPTRELVTQALEVCELCATGSGLKIATAVGSKSVKEEQEHLIRRVQIYDREHQGAGNKEAYFGGVEGFDGDIDLHYLEDLPRTLPGHVMDYTSNVDVLICTPGRLVDHMRSTKGFTLDYLQWLVLDEADRLLNESFQEWVPTVMEALDPRRPPDQFSIRQSLLSEMGYPQEQRSIRKIILSATMTKDVGKLSALKLRRPKLVVVDTVTPKATDDGVPISSGKDGEESNLQESDEGYELPPTLIEKASGVGDGYDKPLYLLELLRTQLRICPDAALKEPSDPAQVDPLPRGVLVFTNNNENASRLARLLSILHPPYSTTIRTLTKSSSTSSSRKVLTAFRTGKVSILIASDRASRGLDVKDLGVVINYDLPTSVTSYVHRVGRTARAGKEGLAWTLTTHHEARWFWNEIARGAQVRRAPERRVERTKVVVDVLGEEAKVKYAEALKMLGEEAEGKVNH